MSDTRLLLDGEELEPLLARARALGGRVVKVERVRRGGVAGLFGRARYEVTVDAPGLSGERPRAWGGTEHGSESGDRPPSGGPAGLAALLAAANLADGIDRSVGEQPAPADERPVPAAEPPAARSPTAEPAAARPPTNQRPGARPRPRTAERSPASDAGPDHLRRLGVPATLLPRTGDTTAAILELARRLPRPPALSTEPGSVVAVVGSSGPVLRTCRQLLIQLPEAHLVLVGDDLEAPWPGERPTDARESAQLRDAIGEGVLLVAVAAGQDERDRAEAILQSLQPQQVWAAVDARMDAAELADLLRRVPGAGQVQALAAQHVGRSPRPGALLGLDPPVGRLDGLPATPLAWACVLDEATSAAADDGRRATPGAPSS